MIVRVNSTIIGSSHFMVARGLYVVDGGPKDQFLGALEHGRSRLVAEKSVIWCVVHKHTDRQTDTQKAPIGILIVRGCIP